MDETEIAKQMYIGVLVGSLDGPNQTFLVNCHPLDSGSNVNSSIILHIVDDILRQLEIKRENFSLFLTDAARYMSLVGKILKELYPSLMHVTCVAHLLHNYRVTIFSLPKRRTFLDNFYHPYKLFYKAGKISLDIC